MRLTLNENRKIDPYNVRIIGFSGKISTGKSVVSSELINIVKAKCIKVTFADALKQEISTKYNFPLGLAYTQEGKLTKVKCPQYAVPKLPQEEMTIRDILQWYGTYKKQGDPEYWVNLLSNSISVMSDTSVCIVEDCRFPNEIHMVHRLGGVVIRLEPYDGWVSLGTEENKMHSSETSLENRQDLFDVIIHPETSNPKEIAECVGKLLKLS